MPLIINTNMASLNAQLNLSNSQSALQTSLQRLSSGLRINSAKDDAAGLAISARMTSQVNGLDQAARNANDGISMAQTASGALSTITDNLQRMRSLSVQAANGTNSASDRAAIQAEITQLQSNIDQIASTTAFNGTNLLDGSLSNATFQVGSNAGQTISMSVGSAHTSSLFGGGSASQGIIGTATGTTAYVPTAGIKIVTNVTNGGTSNTVTAVLVAATDDGVSYVAGTRAGTTSALAAANTINAASATTNVVAAAQTQVVSGTLTSTTGFVAGTMKINGVDIGAIAPSASAVTQTSAVVQAINNISSQTGVTAVTNTAGTGYTLTAADGRNIDIVNSAVGVATTDGFATGTTTEYGQITLTSTTGTAFSTVGAGLTVIGTAAAASGAVTTTGGVNDSTQGGATLAITNIDNALAIVNSQRALLGAMQNRFTSVISNLNTTSQNLTASRSRIQDTDFAAETANLTRAQILQQAGTAMLAQANSAPNGVLTLLR